MIPRNINSINSMCQVQIFRLQIMPNFELGNRETHNKIEYTWTKGSIEGQTDKPSVQRRRPWPCVALLLLLLLLLLTICLFSYQNEPKRHGYARPRT